MSFVVFSDDIFFTRSAGGLMPIDSLREDNLCIIDIESFFSLHDIKHRVCNELTDGYSIIFVKGRGMLSKVLSSLEGISRTASVTEFIRYINEGRRYTVYHILTIIDYLRELRNLTHTEISVACALRRQININATSQLLHCSTKAVYQRVSALAQKMNLRYGTQIQYFLYREYTIEELQQINCMKHRPDTGVFQNNGPTPHL
ncbi:hypothetical protein OGV36_04575 [Citrobacter sp. Cb008]|uniref:Uncharacterized protein n=1 Tax=Citrobacter braakii TaxID=57706 RepID=A0A1V8NZZ7_CITBR|nr:MULTISPECIES: hypothetical protein [Citrobacter]OCF80985.1 hypothetical protein AS299_08005 [Citrobacter freundii]EGT5655476.1 hypothetical protein [Citrobacter braakii]MBA8128617.1 hypothetical protein [Citrobacter sp. RHBSTW-00013]MBJ8996811.1 hypothetical protein [Citrobacter braakii]MDM3366015.1 hypothetical protein [Citrobacter sp. Cb005]